MQRLNKIFHFIKTIVQYYPFFREVGTRVILYNPILITPKYISLGSSISIRNSARIQGITNYQGKAFSPIIKIMDNVTIEQGLHLTCAQEIRIGKNTAIASNVTITDINHPYEDINIPPEKQQIQVNPVFIGEECKIYNNAVILPGTILGKHCVIGANSVVLGKEYKDYSIVVGSPAKVVKRYSIIKKKWLKTNNDGIFLNED